MLFSTRPWFDGENVSCYGVPTKIMRFIFTPSYPDYGWQPNVHGETESSTWVSQGSNYEPVWVSHDILNEDEIVYLAASEPVPVYE